MYRALYKRFFDYAPFYGQSISFPKKLRSYACMQSAITSAYSSMRKRDHNRRYACSNSRRKLLREFVIDVFLEISMVTRVEVHFSLGP